jgi:hypothetical protein
MSLIYKRFFFIIFLLLGIIDLMFCSNIMQRIFYNLLISINVKSSHHKS